MMDAAGWRRILPATLSSRGRRLFSSTTTDDLIRKLRRLDTACVCDADKTLVASGGSNILHSSSSLSKYAGIHLLETSIRPITTTQMTSQQTDVTMVGRARTVQCTRRNDFLAVLRGLVEAEVGDVLVVNTSDSTHAVAGELFATEALRRQVCGIVVDGPVRDTAQLHSMLAANHHQQADEDTSTTMLRIYASSICPYSGTTESPGKVQTSVTCGGVPVHPGDIVMGDDDGVVVGSAETFEALLPLASEIFETENKIRASLLEGKSLESLTNYREHIESRLAKQDSKLEFRV